MAFKDELCTFFIYPVSRYVRGKERAGRGSTVPRIELIKAWKGTKISLGYFNLSQIQLLLKNDTTSLTRLNEIMDKKEQDPDKTVDANGSVLRTSTITQKEFMTWLDQLFSTPAGVYLKNIKNYI